ncbi:MAG: alpha-L-fucosidase, partial [Bacteroidaceae bacterium]|nr:alpha-L-fucosidase [Bacteroidaceae bacterium]
MTKSASPFLRIILLSCLILTVPVNLFSQTDIWNLPQFKPEEGQYTSNWDTLSHYYNVPEWWREAKFGAWSHWDPQSQAEDGDWYSRGMYQ